MYNMNAGSSISDIKGEDNFKSTALPSNIQVWHTPAYVNFPYGSANYQYADPVQPYQHTSSHPCNINPAIQTFLFESSRRGHYDRLNVTSRRREPFHATQYSSIVTLHYPNLTSNISYQLRPSLINPYVYRSYTSAQTGNNPPPPTMWDPPFDGIQAVTQGGMPIGTVPHRQDQIRHDQSEYGAPRQIKFTKTQTVPMGQREPPVKKQAIPMGNRLQDRPPARVKRCVPPVFSHPKVPLASVPLQYVNPQSSPPKVRQKLDLLLPHAVAAMPPQPTTEVQTLDLITKGEVDERRSNSPTKTCLMKSHTDEDGKTTICNESFNDRASASKHIQEKYGFRLIKDGKGEEEACAWLDCTESFKNVHRHIMEVHFKARYFCPVVGCNHSYTRLSNLVNNHIDEHFKVEQTAEQNSVGQSPMVKKISENQRNQNRLKRKHSSISKDYPNEHLAIFEEDA